MQKYFFLFSFFLASGAYAQDYTTSECYQKYQAKHQGKIDKRERQTKVMLFGYNFRTTNGTMVGFRPDNYSPAEINFFEREVMAAVDFNLDSYMSTLRKAFNPPSFLSMSFEKARENIPTVTYYEVQEAMRAGFAEGDYCRWYGIMRPKQVAKLVSKKIISKRKENSSSRAPAVVDTERSESSKLDSENAQKIHLENSQVKGE